MPDELKPAYKLMQGSYTKKTQELAEARKESQAYKEKADAYEKYQSYIPIVDEMLANREQTTQNPQLLALREKYKTAGYSDEAIEMMEMGIGFALDHVNQTSTAKENTQRLNSQIEQAGSVDPRLNDKNLVYQVGENEKSTFGQIVEELVSSDPRWQEDPIAATKRAIKKVDALIGKSKTEGKEELSASVKSKATKFPSANSSPQSSTATNSAMSIREAFEEARKELGQ